MQDRFDIERRTVLKSLGVLGAGGLGLTSSLTGVASAYDGALASFYEFEGTSAADSSGNGYDGTVNGASPGASGIAGDCVSFDAGDAVDVPHPLSGASSGAYSVWVNATALGEDKAILGDWPSADTSMWYDVGDDVWGFAARLDGTLEKVTGGSPSVGDWTHLVVTFGGGTLRLFVDGTEVDSTSASGQLATHGNIQLGGDEGDHGYWDGRLDQVRTYARSLSAAEVSTLYENPGSAELTSSDSVTDIAFSNQGLAFDPAQQSYSPGDEFIFPSIIETSKIANPLGKYHLYCAPHGTSTTKDGETVGVALFYSDTLGDGSWTEYAGNPIIDPSDFSGVSHISSPHAIYADEYGKVLLYAHGDNHVTRWWYDSGDDGATFDYGGDAVDTSMYSGSSESSYARVYEYSIPNRSNRYTMFFMSNQGGTRHIRLATSTDGKNWTVDPDEVISPQPEHDGNVSGPFFFRYDGMYCLAFHTSDGNQWVAEVGENIDMENHLGMFNQATSGSPDGGRCSSPFLVRDDGGTPWLYYESNTRLDAAIGVERLTDSDDAANLSLFDLS
ncbi:LamG domain-containing protein [Halogranum rubrum]|uniref:LamG-like jellyroll fold domain-containing protein n=1 Tax=Halogranum salarium B-1 TaxID=1210908 RepID=J3ETX7_9EURY|nr:LamG domain-containing protein [Halogranum salarium]EJN57677.1 hypothetical protein HSB1_40380 [Halogranum salarium B-1]